MMTTSQVISTLLASYEMAKVELMSYPLAIKEQQE
jgi:hypothetical protein